MTLLIGSGLLRKRLMSKYWSLILKDPVFAFITFVFFFGILKGKKIRFIFLIHNIVKLNGDQFPTEPLNRFFHISRKFSFREK